MLNLFRYDFAVIKNVENGGKLINIYLIVFGTVSLMWEFYAHCVLSSSYMVYSFFFSSKFEGKGSVDTLSTLCDPHE